jgi:hypothetical protein
MLARAVDQELEALRINELYIVELARFRER